MAEKGNLIIQCFNGDAFIPVDGTKATVVQTESPNPQPMEFDLVTDSSGLTQPIQLDAPDFQYSQTPQSEVRPYSLCDITINRDGFDPLTIKGCQIFPRETAYQRCNLVETSNTRSSRAEIIQIPDNRLFGNFPNKIPEEVDKLLPPPSSGVVLPKPVIPEFIVVHEGGPNSPGPNRTVPFKEYIKNVASSEIYSTWSRSTITANAFCIISFTLNRIYTEWYRSKGKNFDITNSTAYDHAFSFGRNIYENISNIVDEIFSTYVRRIGRNHF